MLKSANHYATKGKLFETWDIVYCSNRPLDIYGKIVSCSAACCAGWYLTFWTSQDERLRQPDPHNTSEMARVEFPTCKSASKMMKHGYIDNICDRANVTIFVNIFTPRPSKASRCPLSLRNVRE